MGFFGRRLGASPRATFEGAQMTRLLADWMLGGLVSANLELRAALPELRARARDLVQNNAEAGRFIGLTTRNVNGPRGIRPQGRFRENGRPRSDLNAAVETAFKRWSRKGVCTVDGQYSWANLHRLALSVIPQDGEVLIQKVGGFDNEFGFALNLIDADRLDHTFNEPADPQRGTNAIEMGIEFDGIGRRVAYHVLSGHPSERFERDRVRIPAEQIVHPFVPLRVASARGVPWFARVLFDIKMMKGYREAEVTAARAAAAKMGFFTESDEYGGIESTDVEHEFEYRTSFEPAMLDKLPPGVQFQSWDPNHPTDAFDPFMRSIMRSVAVGLDVSYASLAGDLTQVNFSSIRQGALDERDMWRMLQWWYVETVIEDLYADWVRWAILAGQLDTAISPAEYVANTEWQPRGWPWVDPLKDVQASVLAIKHGLDSRRRILAEKGMDLEEVLDDLALEQELAAERGVKIDGEDTTMTTEDADEDGRRTALTVVGRKSA